MSKEIVESTLNDHAGGAPYWSGSMFKDIVRKTPDQKGKWGEDLMLRLIKEHTNVPVQWDGDCNTNPDDGTYDLFWYLHGGKKVRVEVKTSSRTVAKNKPVGWQHENIYFSDNKWDKLIFIDYDADDVIYFTIVNYDQVVKNNAIDLSLFGKKGHCRKNEEGKAKVDFSMKSIQNGIGTGVTFRYNIHDPSSSELLGLFLKDKLAS